MLVIRIQQHAADAFLVTDNQSYVVMCKEGDIFSDFFLYRFVEGFALRPVNRR